MSVARRNLLVAAGLAVLAAGLAFPLSALPDGGSGLWSGFVLEIQMVQRDLHRQLAAAMQAVQAEGAAAASALVVLSFLYGVFHAAGPGHGKVVISTYILTQESKLPRGLVLSLVSSLCQGLTAILAVTATAGLLGLTLRQAQSAATGLETVSYSLVMLLGITLVASRARRLLRWRRTPTPRSRNGPPHLAFGHHHKHDGACTSCGHAHGLSPR